MAADPYQAVAPEYFERLGRVGHDRTGEGGPLARSVHRGVGETGRGSPASTGRIAPTKRMAFDRNGHSQVDVVEPAGLDGYMGEGAVQDKSQAAARRAVGERQDRLG